MGNIISEDAANAPQAGAGAADKIRKSARQLAYDVRYKVKQGFKDGQKTDPVNLKRAYLSQLGKSPAPGNVKALAKKMLVGEEYDFTDVSSSISKLVNKAFLEHHKKDADGNTIPHGGDDISEEEMKGGKYKIRVKDKKTGKSYVRMADRAKIAELRKNPNIESVEMTGYGSAYEGEKKKGEQTARTKSGKGLDPVGKEDGDVNNDGKKDKTDSYLMNRRKAIGKAMAKEEFIGEVAETNKVDSNEKKVDVMKGKNKININPDMKEGMEKDKKKEEDEGSFDAMKTLKPDASKDDPRSMPTLVNLMKNKLRAKGLNMSFKLNGQMVGPTRGQKLNMYGESKGEPIDEIALPTAAAGIVGGVAKKVGGAVAKKVVKGAAGAVGGAAKGLVSSYEPQKPSIDEVVGQIVGGALGATKGAAMLGKMGVKGAIAQKAAGGAIGAAAGEVLDPFKKGKDKNPVAAAAGGAAGGAVSGGALGKIAKGVKGPLARAKGLMKNSYENDQGLIDAYQQVYDQLDEKRSLADRMDRKSKLYDKTVKKAMDFARNEGEASGHARYNMSRLGREKDKLAAKRRETNEEVNSTVQQAVEALGSVVKKNSNITELNRFEKEKGTDTKTGKPIQKGGSAKKDLAYQAVMKKYSNQRMGGNEPKKVRGAKSDEGTGRITKMVAKKKEQQAKSKALDAKAKKAGYKTTQDYVNVQAVRKGGLGT